MELRDWLKEIQSRMKKVFDSHLKDREFSVGDLVYLHLQPYRQTFITLKNNLELSPRFYGPFKVIQRIGPIAYKLDLPDSPSFSLFSSQKATWHQYICSIVTTRCQWGWYHFNSTTGHTRPLDKKRLQEVLVHWHGLSLAEATWEELSNLQPTVSRVCRWGQVLN